METEVYKHNAFPWNFFPYPPPPLETLLHGFAENFTAFIHSPCGKNYCTQWWKSFSTEKRLDFPFCSVEKWLHKCALKVFGSTNQSKWKGEKKNAQFLGWDYSLWVSPDECFSTSHVHWCIFCKDHNSLHQCPNRHPSRLWHIPWFLKHSEHRHRK